MLPISSEQRRQLRAQAHALAPVVAIAQHGLSDAVLKEIDVSLKAHELIKIRVYNDDRAAREDYLKTICETLAAAPVQHIGKLLVVWRPRPEEAVVTKRTPKKQVRRTKRSYQ
jgi:putative YhbY family RNA-binding protein